MRNSEAPLTIVLYEVNLWHSLSLSNHNEDRLASSQRSDSGFRFEGRNRYSDLYLDIS